METLFPIETTQVGTVFGVANVSPDGVPTFFRVYCIDPKTGLKVEFGQEFVDGLNDTVGIMEWGE